MDQYADYSCGSDQYDLTALSGTSMATPLVAGSAALVRQYYVAGYQASGIRDPTVGIQPSAALMKATLINSAVHASTWGSCRASNPVNCLDQGAVVFNKTTVAVRANHEGFGVVQLDQALSKVGNDTVPDTDVTLFSFDACHGSDQLTQGQQVAYSFVISNVSRPFKAVLVWTDPVASPLASVALVNNLDLTVTYSATGQRYLGNNYIYGVNQSDYINNVEQVWIDNPSID